MRAIMATAFLFLSLPAGASDIVCEGDACDVLSPLMGSKVQFDKPAKGVRELRGALSGLSGALIGNEIAGEEGAIFGALLGISLGYDYEPDLHRLEREARERDAAWKRGDDMFFNPAHPIPYNAHYLGGGKRKKD
ncbi:MAG: hypothetical protein HWE25_09875 [Alphaproteobacteria bacterium]|nr:hypothetical protein [Alphaproteobacteria bacterium]